MEECIQRRSNKNRVLIHKEPWQAIEALPTSSMTRRFTEIKCLPLGRSRREAAGMMDNCFRLFSRNRVLEECNASNWVMSEAASLILKLMLPRLNIAGFHPLSVRSCMWGLHIWGFFNAMLPWQGSRHGECFLHVPGAFGAAPAWVKHIDLGSSEVDTLSKKNHSFITWFEA